MKKIIIFSISLFLIASCSKRNLDNQPQDFDRVTNAEIILKAPGNSKIKRYIDRNQTNNYDIKLDENLGHQRTEIEIAYLKLPTFNKYYEYSLKANHTIKALKTPIELLSLVDDNQKEILFLRQQHGFFWLGDNQSVSQVAMFPHFKPVKMKINISDDSVQICMNKVYYEKKLDHIDPETLMIGIKRFDLLRYTGQVIPEQNLKIHNLIEKRAIEPQQMQSLCR